VPAIPAPLRIPSDPTAGGLPPLRLLPAPVSEPPYDDELGLPVCVLEPLVLPPLHLVPPPADDDALPARAPIDDLPSPGPFAHALVQRLLEVMAGVRPIAQLQRDVSFELYQVLEQTVIARPRATGLRPPSRAVRSLHVQPRPDGVAEVCATVQRGPRAAALALRLEGAGTGWRCTDLVGL